MVDFNNDSTVSTPPGDVVKILVLERREQCIEAIESYYTVESSNVDASHKAGLLRSRLLAYWYQVQAMARRRLKDDYEEIEKDMKSAKKTDDLLKAFEWLNEFTDDLGLTYIDTKQRYDRTHVEDANKKKGL